MLKELYEIAPIAMDNPNFYLLVNEDWSEAKFNPGNKALPTIIHVEQGWTDVNMLKVIILIIYYDLPPRFRSKYEQGHVRYKDRT